MRPLSLRQWMERAKEAPADEFEPDPEDDVPPLVDRLAAGDHPVEISIRPERTLAALRDCLDREYVHVKFTGTRGGTELGIRVDPAASRLGRDELERGVGSIHLEGTLTLDYVPVRCVADIDVQTMTGEGRLVKETASA
jgi:hypothetical protein